MKRILIIDDDNHNIFALEAVLKSKDFKCISANSAEKGLSILEKEKDIGVVLLDMMMPYMDGYETMSKMKAHNDLKQIPVVAVTAQAMPGDRERCLQAGAVGYISKPINVNELVNLVDKLL